MDLAVEMGKIKAEWFPSSDDVAWKQWVDFKSREERDLLGLLGSDVRYEIKRRAVFLLLVPSDDFNPIYWKGEVGKFYHDSGFLKGLDKDLLIYASDLIIRFVEILRPVHCEKPRNVVEGGGAIKVYAQVQDKYHRALYCYNHCILILLGLIPAARGEQLFSIFSLRDISTFANFENCSGYNPFQSLLYSDVGEAWKERADAAVREIIRDEVAGKTQPREEWEGALKQYASIVQMRLYGCSYGVELFAKQMDFIVDEAHYGNNLIELFNIPQIYDLLAGEDYGELRQKIAKFAVAGNGEDLSVYSERTLCAAQMILAELRGDGDLASRVQAAIDQGRQRLAAAQAKEDEAARVEKDILDQMR